MKKQLSKETIQKIREEIRNGKSVIFRLKYKKRKRLRDLFKSLIIKDYFIRVMGVPEENIISIIDSDATKARIEGYLKQYIPSNVAKGTTLYVYFAGHGYPDMKKGDPYLVPYDGDPKFIEQTGYKLKSFYQDLDNLNIKKEPPQNNLTNTSNQEE